MIPLKIILKLFKIGLKLVPLKEDSHDPSMSWTPIYEDEKPWTDEELREKQDLFHNVATCFGKVKIDGKIYFLNAIDVDGKKLRKLNFIKQLIKDCIDKTLVIKTKKGYHIYWLSTAQNDPVLPGTTQKEYAFEIKTDKSSGLAHLPPSVHRDDPKFRYENIGQNKIMLDDGLYALLKDQLQKYIIKASSKSSGDKDEDNSDLEEAGESLFQKLNDEEIDDIVNIFEPCWIENYRNDLILRICGAFVHKHKSQESAEEFARRLHGAVRNSGSLNATLAKIRDTYNKGAHGRNILGVPSLTKYLEKSIVDKIPTQNAREEKEHLTTSAKERAERIVNRFLAVFYRSSARIKREREQDELSAPPKQISFTDIFYAPEGYYTLVAQIVGATTLYKMTEKVKYTCATCNNQREFNFKLGSRPKVRPVNYLPIPEGKKCTNTKECRQDQFSTLDVDKEEIEVIDIELADPDTSDDNRWLAAKFFKDDTRFINENEVVTITGRLFNERRDGNIKAKIEPIFYAESVQYEKREEMKLTPEIVTEVMNRKNEILSSGKKIIEVIRQDFAPLHIGDDNYKEEFLEALTSIGIPNDENRDPKRLRINIFEIGSKGTGKSELADEATYLVPNAGRISAQATSGMSLSAQISMDDHGKYTIRRGPISAYNNSAIHISEFNRRSKIDQEQIMDFMEEGVSYPVKYSIRIRVIGNTVFFLTANPVGSLDGDGRISYKHFGLSSKIISRLDSVQYYKNPTDGSERKAMLDAKDKAIKLYTAEMIEQKRNYLRKHLLVARSISITTISDSLLDWINTFVADSTAESDLNAAEEDMWRIRNTIKRRAIARAKLKLKSKVEYDDVKEVIDSYSKYLKGLGREIADALRDPKGIALDLIVQIAKEVRSEDLLIVVQKAMNKDATVNLYLTEKSKPLIQGLNSRLDEIVDTLQDATCYPNISIYGKPAKIAYIEKPQKAKLESDQEEEKAPKQALAPDIVVSGEQQQQQQQYASDLSVKSVKSDSGVSVKTPKNQVIEHEGIQAKMASQSQKTEVLEKSPISDLSDISDSSKSIAQGDLSTFTIQQQQASKQALAQIVKQKASCPLPEKHVYVDFEWDSPNNVLDNSTKMTMASFIDYNGNKKPLHIDEFKGYANPERQFLKAINKEFDKYDCVIGWHTGLFVRPDSEPEDEEEEDD